MAELLLLLLLYIVPVHPGISYESTADVRCLTEWAQGSVLSCSLFLLSSVVACFFFFSRIPLIMPSPKSISVNTVGAQVCSLTRWMLWMRHPQPLQLLNSIILQLFHWIRRLPALVRMKSVTVDPPWHSTDAAFVRVCVFVMTVQNSMMSNSCRWPRR